jgi:hypothetical protein
MGLNKLLNSIGNEITTCNIKCEGVENKPKKGIYPRCFYPERKNKKLRYFDYIVIGINPGTASDLERDFVKYIKSKKKSNFGFEDIRTVMKPIVEGHPYYKRVREFLKLYPNDRKKEKLNILWTELVKCQNQLDEDRKKISLKQTTENRCFEKFLRKEIGIFASFKRRPVLVLLGNKVSNFIIQHIKKSKNIKKGCYPFFCLKLYHPTGSRIFNSYYFRGKDIDKNIDKNIKNRLRKKHFPPIVSL